jgi:ADP-ribosylglycohydrolase
VEEAERETLMNSDHGAGPRFVKRTTSPRVSEDDGKGLIVSGGPPRYRFKSDGSVRLVSVADTENDLVGYLWFNDEDDAASWVPLKEKGSDAVNLGAVWKGRLEAAKARGLTPSQAVTELIRQWPSTTTSHIVQGSLAEAPSLRALKELAGHPAMERVRFAAAGSLFGLAIGDAMGYPTEFLNMAQIAATFGSWRRMGLPLSEGVEGDIVLVTDDTQMALAVGEALVEASSGAPEPGPRGTRGTRGAATAATALTPAAVEAALRKHFVAWLHDPDNNRAPGATCLNACAALERGLRWQDATVLGSKGCGANMRVTPVALIPGLSAEQRAGIAQLQAALTHGHPTALAASDLTAHATWLLAHGCALDDLLPRLRAYAQESRHTYHADWLGDLSTKAGAPDPSAYIALGWDECLRALDTAAVALRAKDQERDPSEAVGAGWVAEEALATALYCFLVVDGDARGAVMRASHSSGDSDSIAALAGAFAGARHGTWYWPPEWREALEYKGRISRLAAVWDPEG